jgi:two-component system, OmpR family, phosphate regulon response regulator PhoB
MSRGRCIFGRENQSGPTPVQSQKTTVLLACSDGNILTDLRAERPEFQIMPVGNRHIGGEFHGPLWGFIDWVLPEISGIEICRRLKTAPATAHAHITMLLDEDDRDQQVRALQAGADDYLTGLVDVKRLVQRLDLYRSVTKKELPIRKFIHGDLIVDTSAYRAQHKGRPLALGPTEFRLLTHFMEHPDRVFSRQSLISVVGKDGSISDDRTVNVWVGRLRKAFADNGVPDPLRTVRSVGYVFDRV